MNSSSGLIGSACSFYRHTLLGQVEGLKSKLDPISVLAVIALLKYKESLTLLGFKEYQLTTEAPSDYDYGVNFQGIVRRFYCEGREDLEVIPFAIVKGALWFEPEKEEKSHYKELFKAANAGLSSLQETYKQKKSGVTVAAITEWQKLIESKIKAGDVDREALELSVIEQKVKDLWSKAEIQEVNSLLAQMTELQGDTSPNVKIKCPEQIERLEFLLRQKGIALKKIYEG